MASHSLVTKAVPVGTAPFVPVRKNARLASVPVCIAQW